jgi:uncharacterized protein YdhG (YjbR/CyaY superfamily)
LVIWKRNWKLDQYDKNEVIKMNRVTHVDVASYMADFPPKQRKLLRQLRALVKKLAPKAEERISYGIPGYFQDGMLVYFAGYNKHIGFYPGAAAIADFKKELSGYKLSKGTVQFPVDAPLPVSLITRMVKFRIRANAAKAKGKTKTR